MATHTHANIGTYTKYNHSYLPTNLFKSYYIPQLNPIISHSHTLTIPVHHVTITQPRIHDVSLLRGDIISMYILLNKRGWCRWVCGTCGGSSGSQSDLNNARRQRRSVSPLITNVLVPCKGRKEDLPWNKEMVKSVLFVERYPS